MNTDNSEKFFRKAKDVLVGGVNSPVRSYASVGGLPRFISRAQGAHVYDVDGNRYIDYVASWGPLVLGHAHPSVVEVLQKKILMGTSFGAPCELETDLATLITQSFSSIEKVRLTNSGTEAAMSAVRLARAFTHREYIVKFEGCYHGHSDFLLVKSGSGATTFGHPSSAGVPESLISRTLIAGYNDIDSVKKLFKKYPDKIAGIIIEPVAGNMGVVLPRRNFLEDLRSLCSAEGALLIFDEVITGFRLARGGAQEIFGVIPDITCLGKIIGGGLPVGAYGAGREIMKMVSPEGPMYQAGTLSGNPLAVAAGIATIEKLDRKTYRGIEKMTACMVAEIREIIERTSVPVTLNSVGSMFTVFFTENQVTDYAGAVGCDTVAYAKFFRTLLQNGVMFPPSQFETVFLSAVHTEEQIDATLKAVGSALQKACSGEKR